MLRYWTQIEFEALEQVENFEQMADIALIILKRMNLYNPEIIEICGPMSTGGTGSLEANMAVFQYAVIKADQEGLMVFDQVPFQNAIVRIMNQRGDTKYCEDILEIFYRRIFESGYIYKGLFLPGWESSKGARWERNLLQELHIHIDEYPTHWLEGAPRFLLS